MKIYVLNTGYLETDKNNVQAGATIGTKSNPKVENEWIKLPVMCFLIENEGEYILYDVGSHPDAMNGYWPEHLQEVYPLYQTDDERIENQLALCGVKPEDITKVVISHMHLDHAGNLHLFKHADIYVPKADLDVEVNQYHLVEEDFELAPGVEIINLPGHTPGLLGMVVHTKKDGTFILPQDCIYTEAIFGPPAKASGLLYDSLSYFKSIEKVRKLKDKYDAKLVFAHDYEFFKTLKTAPEYYGE